MKKVNKKLNKNFILFPFEKLIFFLKFVENKILSSIQVFMWTKTKRNKQVRIQM